MTTRSAPEPTALQSPDGRSHAWKHAFVYLWLTFSAVSALVGDHETAVVHLTSVALTAALGGWYWWWHIAATPQRRRLPDHAYLIGGLVIWAVLVALNPSFLLVGVSILAPYCFDRIRWALAVLTPFAGLWLWQRYQAGDGLAWFDVAVCLLVISTGAVVTGYVGTLARENAERQRLIDELRTAQTELAEAEREAGVLAERQRLARDIHDTLSQGFASIVMLLEAAEAALDAGHSARRQVSAALRSARENLVESRRVVWALRPDGPAAGRLPDAVGLVAAQLERETGLRARLVVTGEPHLLDPRVETALLRIAQEALANVRKHASASYVTVTISYMADVAMIDVQDDGAGFHPESAVPRGLAGGLGLRAMRERAEELGGQLMVESAPGEGTTVTAQIPLDRPTAVPEPPEAGVEAAIHTGDRP